MASASVRPLGASEQTETPIFFRSQQVNESTSQQVNEFSNYRDFELLIWWIVFVLLVAIETCRRHVPTF